MLNGLTIRDMVLIARADLRFQPGLNVLTGETGAGKSILLDSLGFVLGWRTRGDLLRAGATQGEVAAEFTLPATHPAQGVLAAAGLPVGAELILRRVTGADGRRQAFVNDRRVTAETLRALSDTLVELHGQQDDRALLDPGRHRAMLDTFAGVEADLADSRAAWADRTAATARLAAARADLAAAGRDADYLKHAVAELDALDPMPGEEPMLDARRRALRAAAQVAEDFARATEALGPAGAEGPLLQALRLLEAAAARVGEIGLDPVLDGLGRVIGDLGDVSRALETLVEELDGDPRELETVEERLFAIRALARKHQVEPEALPVLADDLRARLRALDDGAAGLDRLEADLASAEARHAAVAARLTAARVAAAGRLEAVMTVELEPLRLGRAVFRVEIEPAEPGPDGADRVRFTAATNPGAAPSPIERVASGGELSRFLLALKVCLSARGQDIILVFDEIDRGVGGATADAIGRRLKALGAEGQVLVVTHSPQVAARGTHHWQVGKTVTAGAVRTEVQALAPGARVEEVARMLSGDTVTEEARAAARALLDG